MTRASKTESPKPDDKRPDPDKLLKKIAADVAAIKKTLERYGALLDELKTQGEQLMALADDLKAGIAKLDAETNENAAQLDAVQANITQLAGRIKNTLSDQEVSDIKAALGVQGDKLGAESARLKELAKDPTNPVPTPPPALAEARAK